jgi:hypothetical protein
MRGGRKNDKALDRAALPGAAWTTALADRMMVVCRVTLQAG